VPGRAVLQLCFYICTTPMPFPQVLRKFSHPNLARSAPDTGNDASDNSNKPPRRRQASEAMPTMSRWWRAKRSSTTGHSSPSQPTFIHTPTSKAESPKSEDVVNVMPLSKKPLPSTAGVFVTNPDKASLPEMIPTGNLAPDKLAEAWDAIKDGPNVSSTGRRLDAIGVFFVPSFQ
jgi:hypothetical protein